ncbi:MAG: hypothetical protein Q9159_003043 [Coniocarpon cinnabarinum]
MTPNAASAKRDAFSARGTSRSSSRHSAHLSWVLSRFHPIHRHAHHHVTSFSPKFNPGFSVPLTQTLGKPELSRQISIRSVRSYQPSFQTTPERTPVTPKHYYALPYSAIRAPDHGLHAWLIAIMAFFGTFATGGLQNSFGIFAAYYKAIFLPTQSLSAIAWIGSLQIFLFYFMGQPVGYLTDRGHFRVFTFTGAFLLVLGIFITSFCTQYWHFVLAQGLVTGSGMGLIFSAGAVCVLDWFAVHTGKALAVAAAGSAAGTMVYTAVFIRLVVRIGFAWTLRVLALLTLCVILPPVAVFRLRVPRHRRETSNYSPTSNSEKEAKQRYTWHFLKEPAYLTLTLGVFFAFWSVYTLLTYLPIYALQTLHLSGPQTANLLISLSGAMFIGRLVPGILSDAFFGPLNTMIPSCLFSAIFSLAWISSANETALWVVCVGYGLSVGGVVALFNAAIKGVCWSDSTHNSNKHSHKHASSGYPAAKRQSELEDARAQMTNANANENPGLKQGTIFLAISFACLTGNPIAGMLVREKDILNVGSDAGKARRAYLGLQIFAGVIMLMAAVLLGMSRVLKVGWTARRV